MRRLDSHVEPTAAASERSDREPDAPRVLLQRPGNGRRQCAGSMPDPIDNATLRQASSQRITRVHEVESDHTAPRRTP